METAPGNAWAAADIAAAFQWTEQYQSLHEKAQSSKSTDFDLRRARPYRHKNHNEVQNDPLNLPLRKPWRGYFWQRLLIPSAYVREFVSEMDSTPVAANLFMGSALLILGSFIGWLSPGFLVSFWPTCIVVALVLAQMEILRSICYLNVSMPLRNFQVFFQMKEIQARQPGAWAKIAAWDSEGDGLCVHDYKVVLRRARTIPGLVPVAPEDTGGQKRTLQIPEDRVDALTGMVSACPNHPFYPEYARKAARTREPFTLFTRKRYSEYTTEILWLLSEHQMSHPRIALFSMILPFLFFYLVLCGGAFIPLSILGLSTGGIDAFLPLGLTGLTGLLLVYSVGTGALFYGFYLSAAPRTCIELFSEKVRDYNHSLGPSLTYLMALPKGRAWTIQDLARSYRYAKRADMARMRQQEEAIQLKNVQDILATQAATIGQAEDAGQTLEENTPEVKKDAPRRRL